MSWRPLKRHVGRAPDVGSSSTIWLVGWCDLVIVPPPPKFFLILLWTRVAKGFFPKVSQQRQNTYVFFFVLAGAGVNLFLSSAATLPSWFQPRTWTTKQLAATELGCGDDGDDVGSAAIEQIPWENKQVAFVRWNSRRGKVCKGSRQIVGDSSGKKKKRDGPKK